MEMTCKVGDLKRLISESSQEFKAVLGPNVESEDKKNNGKAYSDAKKRAKDYDGGLTDEKNFAKGKAKYEKSDYNRTLIDYEPENISSEQQKRNAAIAQGYNSVAEKNNGLEKAGDFDSNKKIVDALKKSDDDYKKNEKIKKASGLEGRVWDEKDKNIFDKNSLVAESQEGLDMRSMIEQFKSASLAPQSVIKEEKSLKTVYFKKTTFLNEGHMISRIPDEFKNEGQQFKMKDKTGNEYIVEWKGNTGHVLGHSNKNGMVESINRMNNMVDYTSEDTNTTKSYRLNEGEDEFRAMLDKVRKLK